MNGQYWIIIINFFIDAYLGIYNVLVICIYLYPLAGFLGFLRRKPLDFYNLLCVFSLLRILSFNLKIFGMNYLGHFSRVVNLMNMITIPYFLI